MTARKKLDETKESWGIDTDLELAEKLNTSKTNIDSWVKRNKIPEKWLLIIGQMSHNGTSVIEAINHHLADKELEILKAFRSLPKEKQEWYYHKLKADEIEYSEDNTVNGAKYA